MNDEFNRNEDGEELTPLKCLAYILGYNTCYVKLKVKKLERLQITILEMSF